MKKSAFLFWFLFSAIIIFALGVQFAYSQTGNPFATTTPSSGAYHNPSEIVCNDCITSANLGSGSVAGSEILDGAIADVDVSNTAGIFTRKINGANGWFFTTENMPIAEQWYSLSVGNPPFPSDFGMGDWTNSIVEVFCDGGGSSYTTGGSRFIIPKSGMSLNNLHRQNHLIMSLGQSEEFVVYQTFDTITPAYNQYLKMRLRQNTQGAWKQFEFKRGYNSGPTWQGTTGIEPQITQFECVIKLLSKCPGGQLNGIVCT